MIMVRRSRRGGGGGLRFAATSLALAVAAAAAPTATLRAAAATAGADSADRTIAQRLQQRFPQAGLGSGRVGQVLDAGSGRTVWSSGAGLGRMPASTMKLATAVTALTVLGPDHTERTRTVYADGTLYLVGGGDQRLDRAGLGRLAADTARELKSRRLAVHALRVDDSLFPAPTLSPGWQPGYLPYEVAPVRALALCGDRVGDTALAAGDVFAGALAKAGVAVPPGPLRHAVAPAVDGGGGGDGGAVLLASRTSVPLWNAVEYMLKVSDNNIAEGLLRLAALGRGRPATWQGGTAVVRQVLDGYGVPLGGVRILDGSGLSRQDRMTAAALADLAALAVDPGRHRTLWPLLEGLPIAGRDGTLAARLHRFDSPPSSCAAGRVHAKTGTLHDSTALAGVARGSDGRWKAFAFVENGSVHKSQARSGLDRLAATVTGCW
ncbi:D-alanyl-D-alanine carboxypeptidase/D-alanyl-D-alanine-endopeptidase [Streptacidiphilus sp. N1-10]|uniref:D-alanyl-D-alanine carboxypeptidase/D-alanyl-D-alanine-endopeptidase n=1 Tax=Streptacidiphilus jeojiensis TaxID=3229225 RepID=A0ABV6XG05_9ACTN